MSRMSDDLISRQEAINALGNAGIINYAATGSGNGLIHAMNVIKGLPAAQPQVVHCKDCKHRHIEGYTWSCPFGLAGGPEFFCGYGADTKGGERE